jgi:hypothetical protein
MLEKWYNDYNGRVPTLTMMTYARLAIEMERRLTDAIRPNQPQKEIENRRPFFNSHIINRIVDENNRVEERLAALRK